MTEQKPINEKKAFNYPKESDLPFYMHCLNRVIYNHGPAPIYHYHDKIELIYCAAGELEVHLFSEVVTLKPGDFIYIAPNIPHKIVAKSETNHHIVLQFLNQILHVPSSRNIPSVEYYLSLLDNFELFRCQKETDSQFSALFFDSLENYSHNDFAKRLALRANIMSIMSYIIKQRAVVPASISNTKDADFFAKLEPYITEKCPTITLSEAAKYCTMNYSYFSRNFKSVFGVPFSSYVIKKRIEKSMDLLSSSSMTLDEIAIECGFSDLSYFIKCFKQERGITPKKFRTITKKDK